MMKPLGYFGLDTTKNQTIDALVKAYGECLENIPYSMRWGMVSLLARSLSGEPVIAYPHLADWEKEALIKALIQ